METIIQEIRILICAVGDSGIVTTEIKNHANNIRHLIDQYISRKVTLQEKRQLLEWRFLVDSLEVD